MVSLNIREFPLLIYVMGSVMLQYIEEKQYIEQKGKMFFFASPVDFIMRVVSVGLIRFDLP